MSIEVIHGRFIRAAESLEETLAAYFPGTPGSRGRDLKERNLTAHFTRALFEGEFMVWHEAIVSQEWAYKSLDLMALSPDGSYLIRGEAKRIYATHKLKEVRDDIQKMKKFLPYGDYAIKLPHTGFKVVLLSYWAPLGDRFPRKWLGEEIPAYATKWSAFIDEFTRGKWCRDGRPVFTEAGRELWFLWAIQSDSVEGA